MKKFKKVTVAHLGIGFKQDFLIPTEATNDDKLQEFIVAIKNHFKEVPDAHITISDAQYKKVPKTYTVVK